MYIDFEERVRRIDPTLEYVEPLLPFNRGFVFRVKRDGEDYVLKGCDEVGEHAQAINREKAALKRARGIKEIPRLIEDYEWVGGDYAFLKEYVPGEVLHKIDRRLILNRGLKNGLTSVVRKAHLRGIANLDIEPRNILISPDFSEARLFDFDNAITNRGYNVHSFGIAMTKDFVQLSKLDL
ncbi:MAG: serine/threonine-protein kinase [Nanoarchaeota archaeon]|nr:serine/threonine-protein kinase [Nanoarchaeota archaeon]